MIKWQGAVVKPAEEIQQPAPSSHGSTGTHRPCEAEGCRSQIPPSDLPSPAQKNQRKAYQSDLKLLINHYNKTWLAEQQNG